MNKFLTYLQWSTLPLALSAMCWSLIVHQVLAIETDWVMVALAFLCTWFFYTRDRLQFTEGDEINSAARYIWTKKYLYHLNKISIPIILVLTIFRPKIILPALIGTGLALLYNKDFSILGKNLNLKKVNGGKIILVAGLWVVLLVLFPAVDSGVFFSNHNLWKIAVFVGAMIANIIIINDLKDIPGDKAEGVLSLPVVIGDEKTRMVSFFLIVLAVLVGWTIFPEFRLLFFGAVVCLLPLFYEKRFHQLMYPLNASVGILAYLILM